MTATAKFLNLTVSWISACVPMAIVYLACCDLCANLLLFAVFHAADQPSYAGWLGKFCENRRERLKMLFGKYFGRSHEYGLGVVLGCHEHCRRCNHGLAGSDITLEQAEHWLRALEIAQDLIHRLVFGHSSIRRAVKRQNQPRVMDQPSWACPAARATGGAAGGRRVEGKAILQ